MINTCAKSNRIFPLLLCLIMAFLLVQPACAAAEEGSIVDPARQGENYSAVLYNNTNGLPTSEANAIAQTSEGFLWIGEFSGLIRYDGDTFERIDSTTGIANVMALYEDSRDRLWIGTNDSGVAMMEQGELRFWTRKDGLGSDKICVFEEDTDGTIYVGTSAGVTAISPDFELRTVEAEEIANAYVDILYLGDFFYQI